MDTETKIKFIEQEHRIAKIVQNIWETRGLPHDDPIKTAAMRALIWRFFSGGTIAVTGGGLIAIGTLIVLMLQTQQVATQTQLIAEQNAEFKEQNKKLQLQIDEQQNQGVLRRRTEIIAVLFERSSTGAPVANRRTRTEALRELVEMERGRIDDPSRLIDLRNVQIEGTDLAGFDLSGCDLTGADLQNANLARCNFTGSDLRATLTAGANFPKAVMHNVNLEGNNMTGTILSEADLTGANCLAANFEGSEMFRTIMRNTELTGVKGLESATVKLAIFSASSLVDSNLHAVLAEKGAIIEE